MKTGQNFSKCCVVHARAPNYYYNVNDTVTIRVRPEGSQQTEDFTMIRPLLCYYSSFFRVLLDRNGPFQWNGERVVEIQEDLKEFVAMQCWINTGLFGDPGTTTLPLDLCKIWVFADKRGIPSLANAAIDRLHEYTAHDRKVHLPTIPYILRNTVPGSKLQMFLRAQYDNVNTAKSMMANVELFHHAADGLHDPALIFALGRLKTRLDSGDPYDATERRQQEWILKDRCQYHQHLPRPTS